MDGSCPLSPAKGKCPPALHAPALASLLGGGSSASMLAAQGVGRGEKQQWTGLRREKQGQAGRLAALHLGHCTQRKRGQYRLQAWPSPTHT